MTHQPRCILCNKLVEPWPTGDGYGHNPQPLSRKPLNLLRLTPIAKPSGTQAGQSPVIVEGGLDSHGFPWTKE